MWCCVYHFISTLHRAWKKMHFLDEVRCCCIERGKSREMYTYIIHWTHMYCIHFFIHRCNEVWTVNFAQAKWIKFHFKRERHTHTNANAMYILMNTFHCAMLLEFLIGQWHTHFLEFCTLLGFWVQNANIYGCLWGERACVRACCADHFSWRAIDTRAQIALVHLSEQTKTNGPTHTRNGNSKKELHLCFMAFFLL